MEITTLQITLTTITVLAVFLNRYNKLSDHLEEAEGSTYELKKFIQFNAFNFIAHLLSGIVILFVVSEIGVDYLVKKVWDVDFSTIAENATDMTVAFVAGIAGNRVIQSLSGTRK